MQKLKVLNVDVDGCIGDLDTPWLEEYNRRYNDSLTRKDILTWDIHTYVKPECGDKIYDILREQGFFLKVIPMDGASELLEKWSKTHTINIVTDVPLEGQNDRTQWLAKYFPFIPKERIFYTGNKKEVKGDLIIDDKPLNLEEFPGIKICIDYTYNREITCEHYRVYSIQQAFDVVQAIEEGNQEILQKYFSKKKAA